MFSSAKPVIASAGALLLLLDPTLAPPAASDGAEITAAEMQAHVDFLASDLLEGRNAGTRGAEIAAEYVANQFQQAGLAKLGESWQMEVEIGRGSGTAIAELTLGSLKHSGTTLIEVPSVSAVGTVDAMVAAEDAASVTGRVALTANLTRLREMRERVAELEEAGAVAVVFVAEETWLEKRSARGRTSRGNRTRETPPAPEEKKPEKEEMERAESDLGDLPPELEDEVREQLEAMGIDLEHVQVVTRNGTPEDLTDLGESDGPGGGMVIEISGGGISSGSRAASDGIPVVRVCGPLGAALRQAAAAGEQAVIAVTRPGRGTTTNVLGLIRGSDPQLADEYVVVGGHYDHVGIDGRGQVRNGADDNASGTSGVVEIAEALALSDTPPRRSVICAAWGAEEKGLIGAAAFCENPPVPLDKIVAYVNLDMISWNDPGEIDVISASDTMKAWAETTAPKYGFSSDIGGGFGLNMSDSGPFVRKEIPTVFFSTGMTPVLHRPTDDADKIDADKAARAARFALDLTRQTANADERPSFDAPDSSRRSFGGGGSGGDSGGGSRRMLGVYPARSSSGEGIVIGGVVENSVAAKIGIRQGDRLLRIGTEKMGSIRDIAPVLEKLKAGEKFEVEIQRAKEGGGEETLLLHGSFDK